MCENLQTLFFPWEGAVQNNFISRTKQHLRHSKVRYSRAIFKWSPNSSQYLNSVSNPFVYEKLCSGLTNNSLISIAVKRKTQCHIWLLVPWKSVLFFLMSTLCKKALQETQWQSNIRGREVSGKQTGTDTQWLKLLFPVMAFILSFHLLIKCFWISWQQIW